MEIKILGTGCSSCKKLFSEAEKAVHQLGVAATLTYLLFPNEFVNVKLQVNTLHNAVLVPTAAVQQGSQGPYVFLLNTDNTVSIKPVVTGVVTGNDTTLSSGISSGQTVVIEGADKLSDGAKVTVENAQMDAQGDNQSAHTHHRRGTT